MNDKNSGMIQFGLPASKSIFYISNQSPFMGSGTAIYTGKTLPCFDDLINIVTSGRLVPDNAYPRIYVNVGIKGYSVYLSGYWV